MDEILNIRKPSVVRKYLDGAPYGLELQSTALFKGGGYICEIDSAGVLTISTRTHVTMKRRW